MNQTDELIRHLAADSVPTLSLPAPSCRMAAWLTISVPFVAFAVLAMSPRTDLFERLVETRFLIEQMAALGTAMIAAMAAFCATVRGLPAWRLFMPLAPLTLWLGALGQGCLARGPEQMLATLAPDPLCFPMIAAIGAAPAAIMMWMLRRGAPLRPKVTMAYGALAATALADFGLRVFHAQDASLTVLVWQFGTVVILSGMAGLFGQHLLRWRQLNP